MRPRRNAIAALLVLCLVALAAPPSNAVGHDTASGGNCGTDGILKLAYSGVGWVEGSIDRRYGTNTSFNARAAANRWEAVKSMNGSRTIDVVESFGEIVARWQDLPGSRLGEASCSGGFIRMDNDLRANNSATLANRFHKTFVHEVGHTLGLSHASTDPRWDGKIPVMSTCITSSESSTQAGQVTQDDTSALLHKNGSVNNQVNPNPGFERGAHYAWGSSGTSVTTITSPKTGGSYAVRMTTQGFYQTVVTLNDNANHTLLAAASFREVSPSWGTAKIEIYTQELTYGNGSSNCSWPTGRNEDDFVSSGPWTLRTYDWAYGSETSWTNLSTTGSPLVESPNMGSAALLRIHNQSVYQSNQQPSPIYVDGAVLTWQ